MKAMAPRSRTFPALLRAVVSIAFAIRNESRLKKWADRHCTAAVKADPG